MSFNTSGAKLPWIEKRAGEDLDYTLDMLDYLEDDETVVSAAVETSDFDLEVIQTPAPGPNRVPLEVKLADGRVRTIPIGKAAVVWLAGGVTGRGYSVTVNCATTKTPRKVERTFQVRIIK